jgi:hypothetical protein
MNGQTTWNEVQRDEIADELHQIIADPKFNSSRRCVLLLRYLVEHTLEGNLEGIKERTLGVEVFGRNTNYDTNSDPVVRVAASEIRKRLARFYQESESVHTVRIWLKAGGYLPSFDFVSHDQPIEEGESRESGALIPAQSLSYEHAEAGSALVRTRFKRKIILWCAAMLAVLALLVSTSYHIDFFRSTDTLVWKPFTDSSRELTVCVADRPPQEDVTEAIRQQTIPVTSSAGGAQSIASPSHFPTVLLVDAAVAYKVSNRLSDVGRPSVLRSASELTLREFRQKPIVLIGGLNNPWSMRLLSNLRYALRTDPATGDMWIQDAQHASNRDWKIEGTQKQANIDYAVVTRVLDPETGSWIMALTGLGPYGTEAAGDLVTAPLLRRSLPGTLRSKKNFQIVLKTTIMNGIIGSPQILTVYTW